MYEGNNTTTVTLTVTGTDSAAVANAALAIKKGNGNLVGYVNNANGTSSPPFPLVNFPSEARGCLFSSKSLIIILFIFLLILREIIFCQN